MLKSNRFLQVVAITSVVAACGMGCTKRPNEEELAKLEQARAAAESAERKLAELRSERMQLEQTLEQKKSELQAHEEERDYLKQEMGKREGTE